MIRMVTVCVNLDESRDCFNTLETYSIVDGKPNVFKLFYTGTHVAGTIAGLGGNDMGVAGVVRSGEMQLHIVQALDPSGYFTFASDLVGAVQECIDEGSHIVSMSLGGPSYSEFEELAFQQFYNDGVLSVAAAGNSGDSGYL